MSPFARLLTCPAPPLKPTGPGTATEKVFVTSFPSEKQQKQLPKTSGDPTSLFTLGAGVLLLAGGVWPASSPSKPDRVPSLTRGDRCTMTTLSASIVRPREPG